MNMLHASIVSIVWAAAASSVASAQCQSVGFTGTAGTPANQGFATVGAPRVDVLPNGTISWRIDPGTIGMFAPPSPPWPGGTGPRQEVRCTMQVVSSPMSVSPTGVHDSGFSVYRGVCIQGGNVVAGVTNDGIFISISTPAGVETEYEFAPFNTTAGPAVYHFEATDHGQTFTAVSATQSASAHRPRGRYSDAPFSWRVGGAGAAPAQCLVSNWTVAQGLTPQVVANPLPQSACPGGTMLASVAAAAAESTAYQWQIGDTAVPGGWRDLNDGPLALGGSLWGTVTGARTKSCLFLHGLGQTGPGLRTRCVLSNPCGSATTGTATLRLLPDFDPGSGINTADLVVMLANFGRSVGPYCCGDIDGDGQVNTIDLVAFLSDFGSACP